MTFDTQDIVRRIAKGDATAEHELVAHYSQTLLFLLRQRTKNQQIAEDLRQDTLHILIKRLRSDAGLDDPTRLTGFVQRTAHNVYIAYVRKEQRRDTHANSDLIETTASDAPTQLETLLRKEKIQAVRTVIDSLKVQRDRDILHRFYVLSQDKQRICRALELSSDNFDRVISRARSRFRAALQQVEALDDR